MARVLRFLLLAWLIAFAAHWGAPRLDSQERTVGLFLNSEGAFPGYTLFAPMDYTTTYLIDNEGRLVHSWQSSRWSAGAAKLLENGHLLRMGRSTTSVEPTFPVPDGQHVAVEEMAWDGTLVWRYEYPSEWTQLHHDVTKLPNGNVLIIAWEYKSAEEAIAAGRDPTLLTGGKMWPDSIFEVQPTGPSDGNIVWEWHIWDHLIQDFDPEKANHGVVAEHPELIDVNYACPNVCGLGGSDWTHSNAVDYNPQLDQIVLSVRHFSEFWIIDHGTTTAEAAGHSGGRSGKGGDLLYRWGNPAAYRAGDTGDQKLFEQHDAQWIKPGLEGEGDILVFNNGFFRPGGTYSSVDEIAPPVDGQGNYALVPGQAYGPEAETWTYTADNPSDFLSIVVSGAQRLPNGNTLICSGVPGIFFEVTPAGETVWLYVNPVNGQGPILQGDTPAPGSNWAFRAYRYGPGYAGLLGKDLTPGGPIELYPPDGDGDGVADSLDNCPFVANPDQANTDGGRRPAGSRITGGAASNPSQDALGDACDPDNDNDALPDASEYELSCPYRLTGDSDDDRIVDGFEVANGANACDAASKPACTDTTDNDSDGLNNCLEHFGYNTCAGVDDNMIGWSTCATPMDSDSDGCADVLEVMDINGDRRVTVADQTLLAKRGVGLLPPSDSDPVFDVNKSGTITVADQTLMAKNTCLLKPGLIGCAAGSCPAE
jgi:Arylsulfotransferase (ASST)/Thrombospondin type 3 repeat